MRPGSRRRGLRGTGAGCGGSRNRLHGARQTGKTTVVRAVAKEIESQYVTLDDLTMLAAAHGDPAGFKQPLLFV